MKHALIIGTGGIGAAIAKQLSGYALTLAGRNPQTLSSLKQALGADAVLCDVSSELEVKALAEALPPLDLLVYAAGVVYPEPLSAASAGRWQETFDANVTGVFYAIKHLAPKFAPGARAFVLGARPELVTFRTFGAYAASKAALAALLEVARLELRGRVSLTLVLPKAVRTPLWDTVGPPPKDALEPEVVAAAIAASLAGDPVPELRVG